MWLSGHTKGALVSFRKHYRGQNSLSANTTGGGRGQISFRKNDRGEKVVFMQNSTGGTSVFLQILQGGHKCLSVNTTG